MNIDLETCFLSFLIGFALYLLVNRVFKVEGVTSPSPPWSCDNRPPTSGNCPDSQCLNTVTGVWACPGEKEANCDSPVLTWCPPEEKTNLDGYKLLTPSNTTQDGNSFLKSKNDKYYNIKLKIKSFKIDGNEYLKEGEEFISYELSPLSWKPAPAPESCHLYRMLYTRKNNFNNMKIYDEKKGGYFVPSELFYIFNVNDIDDIDNIDDKKEILKYTIFTADMFETMLTFSEPSCTKSFGGADSHTMFWSFFPGIYDPIGNSPERNVYPCLFSKRMFYGGNSLTGFDEHKLSSKYIRQNGKDGISSVTSGKDVFASDQVAEYCGQNTQLEEFDNVEIKIQIYGKETDDVPSKIGFPGNLEIDCSDKNISCIKIPCSEVCPCPQ